MPKVRVGQEDGEISLSVGGDDPTTYKVTGGQVTVAEKDVERFLTAIDGSKVAGGSSASTVKKES